MLYLLVIHVSLRHVFDEGDDQFDVGEIFYKSEPIDDLRCGQDQTHGGEKKHHHKNDSV